MSAWLLSIRSAGDFVGLTMWLTGVDMTMQDTSAAGDPGVVRLLQLKDNESGILFNVPLSQDAVDAMKSGLGGVQIASAADLGKLGGI